MKKTVLLTIVLVSLLLQANANVNNATYNLTTTIFNYADLASPTIINNSTWDDEKHAIPVGFTFSFYGTNYTSLTVDVNGKLFFDNLNYIYGFAESVDLKSRGSNQSPVSYKLSGTAPNRVLKIEWKNAGFWGSTTENISFQIWLHEGSNKISMNYGSNVIVNPNVVYGGFGGPVVGVRKGQLANPLANTVLLQGYNQQAKAIVNGANWSYMTGAPQLNTLYEFTPSTISGIQNEVLNQKISIFPVPAENMLHYNLTGTTAGKLSICDLAGRTIYYQNITANQGQISIENFNPGFYILSISNENGTVVSQKFYKN